LRRAVLVCIVASAALVGAVGAAHADGFDEAWNKGQDLFNLGKYGEARAQFEKARELDPTKPGPWRYLGRIAKIQERWEDCARAATTAVKLNPTSPNAPEVRKDLDECRRALGRPPYPGAVPDKQGGLAVIANVEGASVLVDDIKKGATPLDPFPVLPGKHKITVERRGYLPVTLEIEVVETVVVDVDVTLEVDPNAKPDDRPPDPGSADDIKVGWVLFAVGVEGVSILLDGRAPAQHEDGSIEADPGEHTVEISAPGYEPWRRRIKVARGQKRTVSVRLKRSSEKATQERIAYVSFGVAAAAVVSGAVFGLLENQAYEDARDRYQIEQQRPPIAMVPPGLPEGDITTRAEYQDLRDEADRYGLISNVSFGVAAALLGVSVYYFIQAQAPERPGYPLPQARGGRRSVRSPLIVPTVNAGEGGISGGISIRQEWDF
jgi:tetratricopeptide (TPR) repeat protein